MSTGCGQLWSLLRLTQHGQRSSFRNNGINSIALLFSSRIHPNNNHFTLHQSSRSLASYRTKAMQQRAADRAAAVRSTVLEHYQKQARNRGQIDWQAVRTDLQARNVAIHSHFEFGLMTAFTTPTITDGAVTNEATNESNDTKQPINEIEVGMFHAIVQLVLSSPEVASNKIAALRLARFLADYPHHLTDDQCRFVRQVCESVLLGEQHLAPSIVFDAFTALVSSSPANCRFALQLMPRFIRSDFRSKHLLLNLTLKHLIRHELVEELFVLLGEYDQQIFDPLDFDHTGRLIQTLSKAGVFEREPEKVLTLLRFLSSNFAQVDKEYQSDLLDRVVRGKLGYSKVRDVTIHSKTGQCSACATQLSNGLTAEEFQVLRAHVPEIIFNTNDHHLVANLAEYEQQLHQFEDMIGVGRNGEQQQPKFDLVIDCLNVAYGMSGTLVEDKRGLRSYERVFRTADIDKRLVGVLERNRVTSHFARPLLVCRTHMERWPLLRRWIKDNARSVEHCFLANQTRDDPFLLYAAVQHPDTFVLSNDLYRDHFTRFRDWYLRPGNGSDAEESQEKPSSSSDRPDVAMLLSRWLNSRRIRHTSKGVLHFPKHFDTRIQLSIHHEDLSSIKKQGKGEQQHQQLQWPQLHLPIVTVQAKLDVEENQVQWYCASR